MTMPKTVKCSCGKILGPADIKIQTKDGVKCVECWSKKMGKHVVKHPISD
jgi:DNA-directed RNA polymerase subunit RPC12/RpoP